MRRPAACRSQASSSRRHSPATPASGPALREEAGHLRRGLGEPPQGRLDVARSGVRLALGQSIPEDVPQAGEVLPHVFRPDGGDGHHARGPGDVVGEEGRAGGQEGTREVGEVVLGVLDALLPAPLAVAVPKLGAQGILPLDDGLRDRPAAGMDRSAGGGFEVVHSVARISSRPAGADGSVSTLIITDRGAGPPSQGSGPRDVPLAMSPSNIVDPPVLMG